MILAVLGEVLAAGLAAAFLAASFSKLEARDQLALLAVVLFAHATLLVLRPSGLLVANVTVLVSSACAGAALARLARTRSALLALAAAASAAAVVSYLVGPTRWVLERAGTAREWGVSHYLAVFVPVRTGAVPVVGWGDLVVVAAFYTALRGLGAGVWGAAGPPVLGLVAALGLGLAHGGAYAVPFMTIALAAYIGLSGVGRETRPRPGAYEAADPNPSQDST